MLFRRCCFHSSSSSSSLTAVLLGDALSSAIAVAGGAGPRDALDAREALQIFLCDDLRRRGPTRPLPHGRRLRVLDVFDIGQQVRRRRLARGLLRRHLVLCLLFCATQSDETENAMRLN